MDFTQALAEFPKHVDRMDKVTRQIRWRLRGQLALWLAGGVLFVATTAQMIERDAPWWAITLGVLITIPWGVGTASMRPRFEALRELRATHALVQDVIQDDGFREFAKLFTEPPTTPTTADEGCPGCPSTTEEAKP